jgi:hypothetical protein
MKVEKVRIVVNSRTYYQIGERRVVEMLRSQGILFDIDTRIYRDANQDDIIYVQFGELILYLDALDQFFDKFIPLVDPNVLDLESDAAKIINAFYGSHTGKASRFHGFTKTYATSTVAQPWFKFKTSI